MALSVHCQCNILIYIKYLHVLTYVYAYNNSSVLKIYCDTLISLWYVWGLFIFSLEKEFSATLSHIVMLVTSNYLFICMHFPMLLLFKLTAILQYNHSGKVAWLFWYLKTVFTRVHVWRSYHLYRLFGALFDIRFLKIINIVSPLSSLSIYIYLNVY